MHDSLYFIPPHLGFLMSGLNKDSEKPPKEDATGDKWSGSFGGGTPQGTLSLYVFDYSLVMSRSTENKYSLAVRCSVRPPVLSGKAVQELNAAVFEGTPEEELSAAAVWLNAEIEKFIAVYRPELAR